MRSSDACYGARIGGSNSVSACVEQEKVMMRDALRTALIPWMHAMCVIIYTEPFKPLEHSQKFLDQSRKIEGNVKKLHT